MKLLTLPTTFALISAFGSSPMANGYTLGPRLYGWPRSMVVHSPSKMIEKQQALMDRVFDNSLWKTTSSPRYQITDDENKFQIAVDVPGVKMEDIHVSVEEAGAILSITGHRESSSDTHSFKSKFSQSFSLDPTIDSDKFTANLENGVLIVSAPKDMKRIEDNVRKIPITELSLSAGVEEEEKPSLSAPIDENQAMNKEDKKEAVHVEHKAMKDDPDNEHVDIEL